VSPKLPALTAKEVVTLAAKVGFVFDRQKGSHAVYYRARDGARIVVPMHAKKILKPKTLASILDDMGLTIDDLGKLL